MGSGGDIEWSLPCAISFGGAGGGLDFGAACSSTVVVLNTKEAVEYFWSSTSSSRSAAASRRAVGRAVEDAVAIAPVDPQMSNFDAEQYTTYGTSEGLFAGLARTPPGSACETRRTRTITGGRCRDGTY